MVHLMRAALFARPMHCQALHPPYSTHAHTSVVTVQQSLPSKLLVMATNNGPALDPAQPMPRDAQRESLQHTSLAPTVAQLHPKPFPVHAWHWRGVLMFAHPMASTPDAAQPAQRFAAEQDDTSSKEAWL